MKSLAQMSGNMRNTVLFRLLKICAAAALLAVCWAAAGASAQGAPTVTAEYGGLARDAEQSIQDQISSPGSTFTLDARAPGSLDFSSTNTTWVCENLRCRYLNVSWSGITPNPDTSTSPYTITLARNRTPSAADVGVDADQFAATLVPTQISLPIRDANTGQRYVPVPWVGERVTVAVSGAAGSEASDVVKIPAVPRSPVFASRANADQVGSTLGAAGSAALPPVVSVWPKVEGATHYELQYTIRTRSRRDGQRLTKVTYIVDYRHLHEGSNNNWYERLDANWGQHPNASLRELVVTDFGEDGEWMLALISMRLLLGGERGWPSAEVDGEILANEADVAAALSQGRNAIGVRVRPMVACAPVDISTLCADRSPQMGVLALRGRKSKISYVIFEGSSVQEWVSSAGAAR